MLRELRAKLSGIELTEELRAKLSDIEIAEEVRESVMVKFDKELKLLDARHQASIRVSDDGIARVSDRCVGLEGRLQCLELTVNALCKELGLSWRVSEGAKLLTSAADASSGSSDSSGGGLVLKQLRNGSSPERDGLERESPDAIEGLLKMSEVFGKDEVFPVNALLLPNWAKAEIYRRLRDKTVPCDPVEVDGRLLRGVRGVELSKVLEIGSDGEPRFKVRDGAHQPGSGRGHNKGRRYSKKHFCRWCGKRFTGQGLFSHIPACAAEHEVTYDEAHSWAQSHMPWALSSSSFMERLGKLWTADRNGVDRGSVKA